MKKLDEYFALQSEIYEYFGYRENWCVIPIDDCREMYWTLTGEGHGDEVIYSPTKESVLKYDEILDDDVYVDEIYTQRFLPKWVYRGQDYTMVCVNTHADGNRFLSIFSNDCEVA